MIRTRTSAPPRSIQTRLTRLMVLIVMGAFLIVGVIALFGIRANARAELSLEHRTELFDIRTAMEAQFQDIFADLRRVANSTATRTFASQTVSISTVSAETQQRMSSEFIALMQQNPDLYAEMRYVTRSGSVWTEVTNYDGIATDNQVSLDELASDDALVYSLRQLSGNAVVGQILFQRDAEGAMIRPPVPMLRFSAPVSLLNNVESLAGAVQIDVYANPILNLINEHELTLPGRRFLLVMAPGQTIADTEAPADTFPQRGVAGQSSSFSFNEPELDQIVRSAATDFTFAERGGRVFSATQIALENSPTMPWFLLLTDASSVALGRADALGIAAFVASVLAGGLISILAVALLRRTLRPLDAATTLARQMTTGDTQAPISYSGDGRNDEIGDVMQAFADLSGRVETLTQELETQVGRYSRNLEIAARVGRETATLYEMEPLLNRAINLIVSEFGYYHAQVFLVDDVGQNALLRYSHGALGERLLEAAHKIAVGTQSVIGQVTATGAPVVVNDTVNDPGPHRPNPLLPDTRAEMAVPLQIGDRVIGALDIQSTSPNVFGEEDVQTFQLLADQIAAAINNAQLLLQTGQRVEQIDNLNRQLTRSAWSDAESRLNLTGGYAYDLFDVVETQDDAPADADLATPIAIRGEVIGTLAATAADGQPFSDGEAAILRAVAERVALAIENARLFQETQASLAQTSLLYQISRFLNEANTLDDIVEAIVVSVMPDAVSGQVGVFAPFAAGETPELMTLSVDWQADGAAMREPVAGKLLRVNQHPLLAAMQANQVTLIRDVARDERLDDALESLLSDMHAGSAVLIPFSVRGLWRGVILIEFADAREFSEREGRIYTTLIDQVGVAIENRLLLQQTELALSQIQRLYAASRLVNTAQGHDDFIRAAMTAANDDRFDFALALMEGDLDSSGWPTRLHFVARSDNGAATTVDEAVTLGIDPESPLRLREPQVLVPEDTSALAEYIRAQGGAFGAVFPLFSFNQLIALFIVTSAQPSELSADDYEIYRALIGQMSTALQNRRLLEQTEDALDETRRLYETSRDITNANDTHEVYEQTVKHLADADADVTHISVFLAGPTQTRNAAHLTSNFQWTRPNADSNVLRVGARLTAREAPYLKLVSDADGAVRLRDLRHDLADHPGVRVVLDENHTKSLMLAPVRTGRKWIGVLVLESHTANAFDDSFMRYAQAVADQLAVAIDNRQLFEEARLEAQRALALAEVGQLANRVGTAFAASIGEVFVRVAEPAGYDRWMLGLTDDDGDNLVIVNQYQPELDDLPASFALTEISAHSLVDAAQQDRMIVINDPSAYSAFSQYSLDYAQRIGRHIVAPIVIGGNVVGALMVGRRRDAALMDSRDEQLVTTLAAQVAVALENQRLFRSTETALQETSLLYEASRALGDATTDTDLVHVVTEYLTDETTNIVFLTTLSGSDWGTPGVGARIAASWQRNSDDDLDLENLSVPAQQFPAWQLFHDADLLLIDDVNSDTRLTPADRLGLYGMDMRATAILPLRAGRRDLGALVLGWAEPRRFDARDERVFSAFAEQASLKLEASRLLAQTERRARQLATSAEVGRVASTILNLDQLLPRVVDLIREAFGYDHTQIFLMSDDEAYAELRASTGDAGRQLLALHHKLAKGSQSVIGQVTATGEPSIVLDTHAATVVHRPNPYLPDTRAEMAVPLVIKGHVVGALDVQSNQPNAFDEDDVAVLTTLATQISVALDNARLFEQSGRRANEMTFLFNVTTAAASADTLEHALDNVAKELLQSLDALSVSIYLPEVYGSDGETRTLLRPVALAGPDQPLSELSDIEVDANSDNVIAIIADSKQSTIFDRLSDAPGYIPAVHGAQSAVVVPLTSAGQLIGLVAVEADQPDAYDNQTLTLLLTLSGTLTAIIQNQQLLEQLQETNDQLRELDKLKSDFLANMSHELRTPLNSIIGFSRVILKGIDGPLTEMQEQDLTTIYNSGQHLLNLINDILDQAKISAQKMELQIEPFAVKPVIDAVRSIGIGLIKDKPIDIIVDMASGLPQAYGDELRTRQILLNLVSNAAKFTREGAITLRAYTEVEPDTGQSFVRIDVSDTGIGIAEQDIPLLFEAFRQVDSSLTRTVGGTGLGLPIAKSLCEMQGGELLVHSEVNVGSTFSVLVPTEPEAEVDGQASNGHSDEEIEVINSQIETRPAPRMKPPQSMETGMLPMLTKRQILLIEDNPDMVDQFRRILGREGFDIFAATITLEAEAMASGLHPTIIIMDVNFAGGVGWDMLERLKGRDDTRDIPILVVTLSEEVQRATEMGAFRVIQRPFMPEALLQAVQDAEHESRVDRILIIDDQPESVRLLQQILKEHGDYRIFGANSGQDGIALVARRRPNLIIVDLRMPEMDGFAVVEELRANPETANIPILVVTGETLTEAERERLRNLDVLFKSDISLEAYLDFVEGVKTHLTRTNGVH